jgi:hypothetical protein
MPKAGACVCNGRVAFQCRNVHLTRYTSGGPRVKPHLTTRPDRYFLRPFSFWPELPRTRCWGASRSARQSLRFLTESRPIFEIPWPILPETPTQLLKPGIGRVGLRVLPARTATLVLLRSTRDLGIALMSGSRICRAEGRRVRGTGVEWEPSGRWGITNYLGSDSRQYTPG